MSKAPGALLPGPCIVRSVVGPQRAATSCSSLAAASSEVGAIAAEAVIADSARRSEVLEVCIVYGRYSI